MSRRTAIRALRVLPTMIESTRKSRAENMTSTFIGKLSDVMFHLGFDYLSMSVDFLYEGDARIALIDLFLRISSKL